VRALYPSEHHSAGSHLFPQAVSKYYQMMKSIMRILLRLKFMRKPVILMMKKKTKMIQPYQRARTIKAETTSCQRPPKTTKRRCLNRTGWYLNSHSNNKPNRQSRKPECSPNSPEAKPSTDRGTPDISLRSLRWFIPYGTSSEQQSWISSSKHYGQTLLLTNNYSQEGNPNLVKYAVFFLDTWNNHPDTTHRHTQSTDPA